MIPNIYFPSYNFLCLSLNNREEGGVRLKTDITISDQEFILFLGPNIPDLGQILQGNLVEPIILILDGFMILNKIIF